MERSSARLNSNQMKYIVIVLMVLDHIACSLGPGFAAYLPFRIISRLTAPVMAYCLSEGYRYTRDRKKYALRLLAFSLISWVPYCIHSDGAWLPVELLNGSVSDLPNRLYLPFWDKTLIIHETGVIWTLLLGFLCIWLWDAGKCGLFWKILASAAIFWLSGFGDWDYWMVLMCLVFYFLRSKPNLMWTGFLLIAALYIFNINVLDDPFTFTWNCKFFDYRLGMLLVPPFLMLYNGKPGKKSAFHRWFFYLFYPGHLLILGIIQELFIR